MPLPTTPTAGWAQWVVARRSLSDPTEVAYYRAYGPEGTPLTELVRVAGARWAIEEGFERAKDLVGLDQYEVRRWQPWYRHMTLALLAHAYLEVTRAQRYRRSDPGRRQKGGLGATSDLIPLTVPEVRRLLLALAEPLEQFSFRLAWSRWRRRHQAGPSVRTWPVGHGAPPSYRWRGRKSCWCPRDRVLP